MHEHGIATIDNRDTDFLSVSVPEAGGPVALATRGPTIAVLSRQLPDSYHDLVHSKTAPQAEPTP